MKPWIADYRFLCNLSLAPENKELYFKHPQEEIKITLRVINDNPGKLASMALFMIFPAENYDDAKLVARDKAREFLSLLSFITDSIVVPRGIHRLFDWDPTAEKHDGAVINYFEHTAYPQYAISQEYLDSVASVYSSKPNDRVLSAIKLYSAGVSRENREDQYQCFWFALEILAPLYKGDDTSTIKCPRCSSDLFCNCCQETPVTRARTSDGVKIILQQLVGTESLAFFKLINKIRNKLLHATSIEKIENELEINFTATLDQLGRVVHAAIFDLILKTAPEKKINRSQTESFSRTILTNAARLIISPKELTIENLPDADIQLTQHDKATGRSGNTTRYIEKEDDNKQRT